MIKHLIFIGLLFSVNHAVIYCQLSGYITGKLIDSKTSEPVPYATVHLKNSQVGVISNAEGDFSILNNPRFQSDSLMVSCIGFHRLTMAFSLLKTSEMNYLKLEPNIYGLKEVTITARKRRLSPELIIARALSDIKKNNPTKPFSYVSYYRDYIKDSSNYLNLNEAIIQTLDNGFAYPSDSNRHRLLQFRKNVDFGRINISPYYDIPESGHSDMSFKKMPKALIGDQYGNELFILLAHDAIRNFDKKEFSFVDTLTQSFIKNHRFAAPDGIYDGNTLLYKINFTAKPKLTGDIYQVKGAIFIQPDDYSIHRFEYSASYFDSEEKERGIFNIEIEYGHETAMDSKMCIKYISFDNSFVIADSTDNDFFKIVENHWNSNNPYEGYVPDLTFVTVFNKKIDPSSAKETENYIITLGNLKARINNIRLDSNKLYITLKDDNFRGLTDSCKIIYKNLKDINGNILDKRKDIELRQFRELFVQEYNKPVEYRNDCFIDYIPLDQNCISNSKNIGRFWMNTPLKTNIKIPDPKNQ
jgi:hypothetical protein